MKTAFNKPMDRTASPLGAFTRLRMCARHSDDCTAIAFVAVGHFLRQQPYEW